MLPITHRSVFWKIDKISIFRETTKILDGAIGNFLPTASDRNA